MKGVVKQKLVQNLNQWVGKEMSSKRLTAAKLPRALQINPTAVRHMLLCTSMQVSRLCGLSKFFNVTYFRLLAGKVEVQEFLEPLVK